MREKVFACTGMIFLIVLFLAIRNFTNISVGYLCLGAVALLAVIGGGAAVWYLLRKGVRAEKKKVYLPGKGNRQKMKRKK